MRILMYCLAVMLSVASAHAERRVALVIGNSDYQHVTELRNPYNDAKGMAQKLKELEFEVVEGVNLDLRNLRQKVKEFVTKLEKADIALFYYAGHGLQVNGVNYLLPTDAQLKSQLDLDFETVSIDLILRTMEQASKTNLVFLDACRDNPLAENLARSMGTRSAAVGRGLAKTSSGVGTLISFATQPGNVALDGHGDNSPFTTALLKHLGTPGQDITRDLVAVRRDVLDATNGMQVPWENSSLTGEIVLKPEAPKESVAAKQTQPKSIPQLELAYWNSIKDGGDVAYFENYLKRFPGGQFAEIARVRIGELERNANLRSEELQAQKSALEIAFWQSIQNASQPELFESYLSQYPNGSYAGLARLKIGLLKKEQKNQLSSQAAKPVETGGEHSAGKTAEKSQELEVASLPVAEGTEVKLQETETRNLTEKELATAMQTELNRVGCSVGKVDGDWGRRSRGALKIFARETGLELASLDPEMALLDNLKQTKGRVCPLVCGRNQKLQNGKCIAVQQKKPSNSNNSANTAKAQSTGSCPKTPELKYAKFSGLFTVSYIHPCGRKVVCNNDRATNLKTCFWR